MSLLNKYNKCIILPILLAFVPFMTGCAKAETEMGKLYPLVIHTSKNAHMFQVELADTPESLRQGLMHRTSLAEDGGMLFLFAKEDHASFWMRNTLIPLDIIFIKNGGEIGHIHAMAKPLDETAIPSTMPVIAVLELAGGQAEKRGIKAGDKVKTSLLKGVTK